MATPGGGGGGSPRSPRSPKAAAAAAAAGGGGNGIVPSPPPKDVGGVLDSIGSFGGRVNAAAVGGDASAVYNANANASASASANASARANAGAGGDAYAGAGTASASPQQPRFDPVDFLNHHYRTEAALVGALPALRSTIAGRIGSLDESISSTIQTQADLADATASDVARARRSIEGLRARVGTVQERARRSERAVLDITRDMKRLDYAKRHLSRTITALKRLHMLLHAVDRLHAAAYEAVPFPQFAVGASLLDATGLLLGHFDGYMGSIQKMRDVREAVRAVREDLREGVVFGFRHVGLGFMAAIDRGGMGEGVEGEGEGEGRGPVPRCGGTQRPGGGGGGSGASPPLASAPAVPGGAPEVYTSMSSGPSAALGMGDDDDGGGGGGSAGPAGGPAAAASAADYHSYGAPGGTAAALVPPPQMPTEVLADACLLIDTLGLAGRREFIATFCADHLEAYEELFDPRGGVGAGGRSPSRSSAGTAAAAPGGKPSFKLSPAAAGEGGHGPAASGQRPASLAQMERRFAWYRRTLREMDAKFRGVFPQNWNVYHELTYRLLTSTAGHISALLTPLRPYRDRDCDDVTVLLQALQKTVLFEKEMTAWLQRECGTIFLDGSREAEEAAREAEEAAELENDDERAAIAAAAAVPVPGAGAGSATPVVGEDGEELEFDESGKAVAASSAEGIRIKYERQTRERKEGRDRRKVTDSSSELGVGGTRHNRPIPAKPLIGVASATFDGFMRPYIALEEQNMDEQLVEFTSRREVDKRGELPVFTSSTDLFVYIKNSITRCTGLSKGQTFFQLNEAFKDTLRKYASVLEGMLPKPGVAEVAAKAAINFAGVSASSAGINLGGTIGGSGAGAGISSAPSYRIPPGEEVTICHVIDTCEYCADTLEALEDLIRDKIDEKYKERIDMSTAQEAFHDVTAKSIRVLVSGLENRAEKAMRDMASINFGDRDAVGEESPYVRLVYGAIQPFVIVIRGLLPNSYFRNFCDKFAVAFTKTFYNAIMRQKRISEAGSQQLLLDVYSLKTLFLKIPVLEESGEKKAGAAGGKSKSASVSKIAPAMYTKMVTKQFLRIEILLKLVGTPSELLIDMFKSQWEGGSALDLQLIMNLKGLKRNEQAAMLEKLGLDPALALKGAAHGATTSDIADRVQALQGKVKVGSDLSQIRGKVDAFRNAFR